MALDGAVQRRVDASGVQISGNAACPRGGRDGKGHGAVTLARKRLSRAPKVTPCGWRRFDDRAWNQRPYSAVERQRNRANWMRLLNGLA